MLPIGSLFPLNFDETGNQIKEILESTYTDGITGLQDVKNDGKQITGIFLDQVSPTVTKQYKFTITPDNLSYQLENPDDLKTSDFAEIEFAATKMFGQSKKPKNCPNSTPCGIGCIKKGLQCRKKTTPQQKEAITSLIDKGKGSSKATATTSIPAIKKTTASKNDIPDAKKERIALKTDKKQAKSSSSPNIDSNKSQLKGNEASILTGDDFNKLGINNTAISRFVYSGDRGGNGGAPTPELAKKFIGGDGSVFLDHLAAANNNNTPLGKKVAAAANRHAAEMYRVASDEDKDKLADSKSLKDLERESGKTLGGKTRAAIYKDLLDRKKRIDKEREEQNRLRNKGSSSNDDGKDLIGDLLL
ncbi:MAG: hypothetical protein V7L23_29825 [Nostoc sp.]|uniref:hypothetical protein n=1 Tax=Nostoc sp. TaxID=1180 RepID=UPI002FF00BE4